MEGAFVAAKLFRGQNTPRIGFAATIQWQHSDTPRHAVGLRFFVIFAGNRRTTCALMKIVVAYSGGLDTSVILHWLKETYRCEVVAYCADIGQEEELKGLDKKARATGASKFYALDLVEEFARNFIFPMVQAGAIYESQYYLGTSIARPLIAKAQVEIARQEHADTVAHGATGKGNDQCRFEFTYAALAPELEDHRAVAVA